MPRAESGPRVGVVGTDAGGEKLAAGTGLLSKVSPAVHC